MRIEGILKSWNDARGFGCIAPLRGGPEVFVHARAFVSGSPCPRPRQRLSFEIEQRRDGRQRAVRVAPVVGRAEWRRHGRQGTFEWFTLVSFGLVYIDCVLVWDVRCRVGVLYLLASVLCFLLYAADKRAAIVGARRIPESTLLAAGLFGGWPGALLAQRLLRHKSAKPAFRRRFRATLVLNLLLFLVFAAPVLYRYWECLSSTGHFCVQ